MNDEEYKKAQESIFKYLYDTKSKNEFIES